MATGHIYASDSFRHASFIRLNVLLLLDIYLILLLHMLHVQFTNIKPLLEHFLLTQARTICVTQKYNNL